MKITTFRIQEQEKREVLTINVEAENQAESALLIHALNRFPTIVKSWGKVSSTFTWAWIVIPLNKINYKKDYFGNDR